MLYLDPVQRIRSDVLCCLLQITNTGSTSITVNYRIQQIENLFSVDFSDPSLLFKLQYSFYIDAFLKNRYSDLAPLPEKPAGE